jgi:dipeptidase D
MMQTVFEMAGARCIHYGNYPGWKPNLQSSLIKVMKQTYQKLYLKEPEVKVIHAGLECGIIGDIYPELDMVSFGPTIKNPHSPDEKVNIASVQKFWDYLLEVLKNIPLQI